MRKLVAASRLIGAATHLVHGMLIVSFRFKGYTQAQRQARIAWWSAKLLRCMGIELKATNASAATLKDATLVVANHLSWLDIAAIHAVMPQARFVSKADVLAWPLVGRMVAGAGTLFIERERARDALRVVKQMTQALNEAQTVAVFPEGTTSDGTGLLPFHANLMQAAVESKAKVLPVLLRFTESDGVTISQAALYVGDTTLLQSAWRLVQAPRTIVTVTCLPVIEPVEGMDRRALARVAREVLLEALPSS